MQIHQIQPDHSPIKSRRRGRGGKRGTYSGKGMKGQKSRAGSKIKPQMRETILKLPKRRGVKFQRIPNNATVISMKKIAAIFPEGGVITPKMLRGKGLIMKSSKFIKIKLVGKDSVKKNYLIKGIAVSKSAKDVITKAGGSIIDTNSKK